MRMIDADALIEENKTIIDCEIEHPKYQNTVREIIDSAPSIDIVRCKECKYRERCEQIVVFDIGENQVEGRKIGFCSYGERREP